MSKIPMGIYEKALPVELSWGERLEAAARAGYDFMELSIDESDARLARLDWGPRSRAELRRVSAATNVRVLTMCLSALRRFPLGSASTDTRRQAFDIVRRALDFALDVGIRVVLVPGYDVFYEPSDEGTGRRFEEGLFRCGEWACGAGVMLAMENVERGKVASMEQVMGYVDALGSPWFQAYLDVGNLAASGHDVVAQMERGRGHVVGVHVKDTVPDTYRGVPFGAGIVPFVDVFRQLARMNFRGPILVEMWADGNARQAVDAITSARRWVEERIAAGWERAASH
jgi:L-ribulose-5-phosphate 3-epimerase